MKPLEARRAFIDRCHKRLSVSAQCRLLSVSRSGLYYTPSVETSENLSILRLLDAQYLETPFYGVRRLRAWLGEQGYAVNVKRLRRLMRVVNWQTLYRKPRTTRRDPTQRVYPYLLKNLPITAPNQAWAIDITYVPMRRGFLYLCAVIDLHTRYVLSWSLSNTMTAQWCCQVVEAAIDQHGRPQLINSDQGSQFTSQEYTQLLRRHEIAISMDSKGRALDNIFIERLWKSVKYECVYLHVYEDGQQLYRGLKQYFNFYNHRRLHQSLNYQTPASQYLPAISQVA
jgi:putative transposase